MSLTLLFSVGLDPSSLNDRNLVLESAGYSVVSAFSLKEAVSCFHDGDFDLVLLCQSVPKKERDRLISWIRASGSRIPIITVSGNLSEQDGFATETIENDPISLLTGISEVLMNIATQETGTSALPAKEAINITVGQKPAKSTTKSEWQTRDNKELHVPFRRTG